jgi:small subunit ribosomal protein S4
MARYRGAKNRIARRFGINIFGRARNPLAHKPNPAGMHGAKRKKQSDYGVQLQEKQKLKAVYGMISEAQLRKYFAEASRKHQNTPELLMQTLECRLDVVVYRLCFAATIFGAQQLVSHGHVRVDGKKVTSRSFQVRPGMLVSIREKSKSCKAIVESLKNANRSVPEYLECNDQAMTGTLLALPSISAISLPLDINIPMVCDFIAHGN